VRARSRSRRYARRADSATAVWVALSICLVCAFADEAHQSMRDFLIDAFGATAMLTIARGRPTAADGGPRAAAAAAD